MRTHTNTEMKLNKVRHGKIKAKNNSIRLCAIISGTNFSSPAKNMLLPQFRLDWANFKCIQWRVCAIIDKAHAKWGYFRRVCVCVCVYICVLCIYFGIWQIRWTRGEISLTGKVARSAHAFKRKENIIHGTTLATETIKTQNVNSSNDWKEKAAIWFARSLARSPVHSFSRWDMKIAPNLCYFLGAVECASFARCLFAIDGDFLIFFYSHAEYVSISILAASICLDFYFSFFSLPLPSFDL